MKGPLSVQVIDWLMCQVDILYQIYLAFRQPNHNHKRCPPASTHTHTHAHSHLRRFSSSFPIDVPQWHWCCTSSCLTSEFSNLSSGLHILSVVFLAPMPENTGLFANKGWCRRVFVQWLHSCKEPLVDPDTSSLDTDLVWHEKNDVSQKQEKNSCKTCSIIIDRDFPSCWIVDSPLWQHDGYRCMSWGAPLWSFFILHFCTASSCLVITQMTPQVAKSTTWFLLSSHHHIWCIHRDIQCWRYWKKVRKNKIHKELIFICLVQENLGMHGREFTQC